MSRHLLVCALAAALLGGCGGGGAGSGSPALAPSPAPAPMPVPVPVPPMPGDAFTAALLILLRGAPDSTEPVDVEGLMPGMSDGGEPFDLE